MIKMVCPIKPECVKEKCIFWLTFSEDQDPPVCAFEAAKTGLDIFAQELKKKAKDFDKTPLGQGLIKLLSKYIKK